MQWATRTIPAVLSLTLLAIVAAAPAVAQNAPPAQQQPQPVRGDIVAVTVYRGQALVTRQIKLDGQAGLREVVVTDLPQYILPNSIYAESSDGLAVRSVRYRTEPVREDVRDKVRKLDDAIQAVKDKLKASESHEQLLHTQTNYLNRLDQFTAVTANTELTKGVLNADTLKTLTDFMFSQRQRITEMQLKLDQEQRGLQEQIQLLQRQRNEITGGSSKTVRQAVVFVDLKQAGATLRLRYLVSHASWSPSYNIRRSANQPQVEIAYEASIQQMSGEDWSNVAMTLSTATPNLVARSPQLEPLRVTLARPTAQQAQAAQKAIAQYGGYAQAKAALRIQQTQVEQQRQALAAVGARGGSGMAASGVSGSFRASGPEFSLKYALKPSPKSDIKALDQSLNQVSGRLQLLDYLHGNQAASQAASSHIAREEAVSVSYQLQGRTSLPSRSDQQMIQIASLPMQATFFTLATPVLTSYVYDQARIINTTHQVLLAGPTSSYVDGQFVGHGRIPTVAAGEPFTVGFGVNSSLRAERELVEKHEEVQGGNRVVNFTYRLTLMNFADKDAAVRLLDRLPTTENDSNIRVTLIDPGKPLSKAADYTQKRKDQGILRWDVTVPAQATGAKSFSLTYQFRMEYDRQRTITGMK